MILFSATGRLLLILPTCMLEVHFEEVKVSVLPHLLATLFDTMAKYQNLSHNFVMDNTDRTAPLGLNLNIQMKNHIKCSATTCMYRREYVISALYAPNI